VPDAASTCTVAPPPIVAVPVATILSFWPPLLTST